MRHRKRKKQKKITWRAIPNEVRDDLVQLCPPNEYRVVRPDQLPNFFPESLKAKTDSILVAGSATWDGAVYYMANFNRVDGSNIDQQPFGFLVTRNYTSPSGCFINHGDWEGRTISPPSDFFEYVSESNIGNCFPIAELLPEKQAGSLHELTISSQRKAFDEVIAQFKTEES